VCAESFISLKYYLQGRHPIIGLFDKFQPQYE